MGRNRFAKCLVALLILFAAPALAQQNINRQVNYSYVSTGTTFANLTTACGVGNQTPQPPACAPQTDGTDIYCADCKVSGTACTGGGNGADARHIAGTWQCFESGLSGGNGKGTLHTLNPTNLDGTDSIGPFNGARSGEKNLGDFGVSVTSTGTLGSLDTSTCSSVGGSATLTCSVLGADFKLATNIGKNVAIYRAGAAPQSAAPVLTIAPAHTNGSYGGTYFTTYASGCSTPTVYAYGDSTGATFPANEIVLSNPFAYAAGQSLTVDGNNYTISNVNPYQSIYTLSPNLLSSFSTSAVSGNTCNNTWRFQAAFVEANGAMKLGSIYSTAVGPNAASMYNFIDAFGSWDTHAVGIQIFDCQGVGCTPTMAGGDTPSSIYNPQNQNNYLDDPWLAVSSGLKTTAAKFWFHEVGHPYGSDIMNGTTAPSGDENGTLTGLKLVSVSGTGPYTVVLSGPVTSSATNTTMVFDDEPAASSFQTSLVDSNGIASTGYVPKGNYRLAQPLTFKSPNTPDQTIGLRLRGDGGLYYNNGGTSNGQNVRSPTSFVWSGRAFQGSAVSLYHQTKFNWENISISDFGGSTPAIDLDIDGPNSGAASTGGTIIGSDFSIAEIAARVANVNTGNEEFFVWDHDELQGAFSGNAGPIGLELLSSNALDHQLRSVHIGATAIGVLSYFAPFHATDTTFSGFGATALWLSPYTSGPVVWDVGRDEAIGRGVYTPVQTGNASQQLSVTDQIFEGYEVPPDCLFIASGNGGTTLHHNIFRNPALNNLGAIAAATGTACNGIVSASNPNVSFLSSDNNSFGLNQTTPFSLEGANYSTNQDFYQPAGGNNTLYVNATVPTSLTLVNACPFTIPQTNYWTSKASCNVGYRQHVILPFASGTANFGGTLETNINGQANCDFKLTSASDMSSGTVHLLAGSSPDVPNLFQCSETCGHDGTFNVCFSTSNGFELENMTSYTGASGPILSFALTLNSGRN